jgi:hypothetical protein
MTALTLNRRLATLLGWTDIIETGGALLGTPPPGDARNQCRIPDWAGDWRDCGPLIAAHEIDVEHRWHSVYASGACGTTDQTPLRQSSADGERDEVTRHAIVGAVIAKLEAQQV